MVLVVGVEELGVSACADSPGWLGRAAVEPGPDRLALPFPLDQRQGLSVYKPPAPFSAQQSATELAAPPQLPFLFNAHAPRIINLSGHLKLQFIYKGLSTSQKQPQRASVITLEWIVLYIFL
ncbi:hypothetical protein chiPu_0004149 [Chiloscyllium punctatum]|uniref:Uncharacterized protein n=1 Tax=Chiloscyllium punctatum TaxID=137246 RepID=A0A401S5S3_CHIPU|nr:hypothetical protein [Chiloscyllium punctatum]